MIKYLILLTLTTYLLATETIHSSVSAYAESKNYTGSAQKEDGAVYGVDADIHYGNAEYKLTYEEGSANTVQPPMQEDLENQKLFFRYSYKFDERFTINLNLASILKDNIAPTDGGSIGGGGFTYTFNKKLSFNLTGFFSEYTDFDVIQADLRVDYKTKFDRVKVKFTSITKHIIIDLNDESTASPNYAQNANSSYTTTAIKAHAHYKTYHLGGAVYFGKRAFAIMQDGFKVQHHAMEFDRTYAVGAGKTFGPLVIRAQYIYQRATELPMENKDVEISTLRLIANYKF